MSEKLKRWCKAALVRAIKTWAQSFTALVPTTGLLLSEINWIVAVSGATVAAILSLVTSLAGLPEVEAEEE